MIGNDKGCRKKREARRRREREDRGERKRKRQVLDEREKKANGTSGRKESVRKKGVVGKWKKENESGRGKVR